MPIPTVRKQNIRDDDAARAAVTEMMTLTKQAIAQRDSAEARLSAAEATIEALKKENTELRSSRSITSSVADFPSPVSASSGAADDSDRAVSELFKSIAKLKARQEARMKYLQAELKAAEAGQPATPSDACRGMKARRAKAAAALPSNSEHTHKLRR